MAIHGLWYTLAVGARLNQLATQTALAFALVCAAGAMVLMILFIPAVDPPGKPRVPAALLKAVDVEKLHEIPSAGYPKLALDATGAPDPAAEAANIEAFARVINPAPALVPYVGAIALTLVAVVAIAVAMIGPARQRSELRHWAFVVAVGVLVFNGAFCALCGAGLDSRALKFGASLRSMESSGVVSIAKWNEQVDLGNLPPSARAEGTISEVLYDLSPIPLALWGSRLQLIAAISLCAVPLSRWIWRNLWVVTDADHASPTK